MTKIREFKVVKGGANEECSQVGDQAINWRKKFAELREIEVTLRKRQLIAEYGGFGPRGRYSALVGVVAGGVVMAGLAALSHAVKVGSGVFNGVPLAVLVLVYILVRRNSTKPLTYTAKLDG